MVGSKHSKRGTKGSLNSKTAAAALSAIPPLGYKTPPTLIDFQTTDSSVITQRIKNYHRAYKTLLVNSWNKYVSFGIQDFVGPDEYFMHCANETLENGHLRLARYYRKHLENRSKIDSFLLQSILAVETALQLSHPGFFDMSLKDMDIYLTQRALKPTPSPSLLDTTMEVDDTVTAVAKPISSRSAAVAAKPVDPATLTPTTVLLPSPVSTPLPELLIASG